MLLQIANEKKHMKKFINSGFGLRIFLMIIGVLVFFNESRGADLTPDLIKPNENVVIMETPDGLQFGIWGKNVHFPAPTLFIFAGSIKQTLGDAYYRQCGNQLAAKGFLCVTLDLPGHGLNIHKSEPEGLSAWRYRSDLGEDFVATFTQKAKDVLQYLIAAGYTDAGKVAACGTSRGGFMALRFTAVEKLIRATAAFSPVTELMTLHEYKEVVNENFVKSISLLSRANQFVGRSLWLIIGDRDKRVGTDNTIEFARKVTNLSLAGMKDPDVTLIVQPEPRGHTTPAQAPERAAKWILKKLE